MHKFIKPIAIASVAATASFSALAAVQIEEAEVEILSPITITEVTPLSFGKIIKSSNPGTSDTFQVGFPGSVGGDGNGQSVNSGHLGEFSYTATAGADYQAVFHDLGAGTCSDPGLSLSMFETYDLTGNASTLMGISALLTVADTTTDGSHTCQYEASAQYI